MAEKLSLKYAWGKYALGSSLDATYGWSAGVPIRWSQTLPSTLPKASMFISHPFHRQAVSNLSNHSKKSSKAWMFLILF